MSLAGNEFSGELPITMGFLSTLEFLSLSFNNITGAIPLSFADLIALKEWQMRFNDLSEPLPDFITALPQLELLNLQSNRITGELPHNVGPNLWLINFSDNRIRGKLPPDWDVLANQDCFAVDLKNNELYGCIPSSYSALCTQINALNEFCFVNSVSNEIVEFETDGNNLDYDVRTFCFTNEGSCCDQHYVVPECERTIGSNVLPCELNCEYMTASSSIYFNSNYAVNIPEIEISASDSVIFAGEFEVPVGSVMTITDDGCND